MRTFPSAPLRCETSDLDLDGLLQPALAFGHPSAVVADPDLSLNEKRAILAAWASDTCADAVEAAPHRDVAGPLPVSADEVLEALRMLDRAARSNDGAESCRRAVRRWRHRGLRRDRDTTSRLPPFPGRSWQ